MTLGAGRDGGPGVGTEFEFSGSGDLYDQQYGCASDAGPATFRSVLYRDVKPPPPPPTTQPPTTQPPTTQPPTTQPPTTLPPPPEECIHVDKGEWKFRPNDREIEYEIGIDDRDLGYRDPDFISIDVDALEASVPGARWPRPDVSAKDDEIGVENRTPMPSGLRIGDLPREVMVTVTTREGGEERLKICMSVEQVSPIGLDIDGSGAVERISGEFAFDFDGNGEAEIASEWFAPTEGILFDSRVSGTMSGAHLFGDQAGLYGDGFEKLALLDGNGDGQVAGAELAGLAIWTDRNSNAAVDAGEISSLADHQVVALSTSHVGMASQATLADGSAMLSEDLWFPLAPSAARANTLAPVGLLALAGVGLLALTAAAAGRRRDGLDQELVELLETEQAAR